MSLNIQQTKVLQERQAQEAEEHTISSERLKGIFPNLQKQQLLILVVVEQLNKGISYR